VGDPTSTDPPGESGSTPSVGTVSTRSDDSPPRVEGTIAIAAVLTAVAGFVDAHIFVHVTEVFVANQSGNVVLFGIFLGERGWPEVAAHLLSITMFAIGVAVGTSIHDRRLLAGRRLRPDLILYAEAVLLGAVIALRVIDGPTPALTVDAMDYPVILLGALAMGLQTVVIGRVGSVAVATTYESGAVARVGEELALSARPGRAVDRRHRHSAVAKVLLIVVASYAAGATLAAAADRSPAWLLVPTGVVLVCATFARRILVRPPEDPTPG
jgi:uncharacterized membrane protein YoaK (UPF0700 family)